MTTVPPMNGASLQLSAMDDQQALRDVRAWLEASAAVGAPWNVSVDEPGTANAGLRADAAEVRLTLLPGSFDVRWFDPRDGGSLHPGSVEQVRGGTTVGLGTPPSAPQQDWVVKVTRTGADQAK